MTRYLTIEQLTTRYHVCRMTLFRWQRDQQMAFPKPIQIGRRKLWNSAELDLWDATHRLSAPNMPGVSSAA